MKQNRILSFAILFCQTVGIAFAQQDAVTVNSTRKIMLPGCSNGEPQPTFKQKAIAGVQTPTDHTWKECIDAGVKAADQNDLQGCAKMFQCSLDIALKSGNTAWIESSLDNLGWVCLQIADYPRGESAYKALVERLASDHNRSETVENRLNAAKASLSSVYRLAGKLAEAEASYRQLFDSKAASVEVLSEYNDVLKKLHKSKDAEIIETELAWLRASPSGKTKRPVDYVSREQYYEQPDSYSKMVKKQVALEYAVIRFNHGTIHEFNGKQATVAFTIRQDGQVSNPHFEKPSGLASFDQEVLEAIQDAEPFPPLPANIHDSLYVEISLPSQQQMRWESNY